MSNKRKLVRRRIAPEEHLIPESLDVITGDIRVPRYSLDDSENLAFAMEVQAQAALDNRKVIFSDELLYENISDCGYCYAEIPDNSLPKHVLKNHLVMFTPYALWARQGEDMAAIRASSNRNLIRQMELWGWKLVRTRNEDQLMSLTRDGEKYEIVVPRAEIHKVARPHVFLGVYSATGVSSDTFWQLKDREDALDVPRVKEIAVTAAHLKDTRQISNRVLEILQANDGGLSSVTVAEWLGLTKDQVNSAMAYLYTKGLAKRVKNGMYEAVRKAPKIDHDVQVHHDEVVEAIIEQPKEVVETSLAREIILTAPSSDRHIPSYEEIVAILEMLAPGGVFKARHLSLINEWVDTTQNLIKEIYKP